MRSDWQSCIIGDLLETIIDYRGKTPPKSNNGIPTLTAANVKGGRIDLSSVSYVSKEIYDQWTTRGFPESGDVIITTEAPVGEVAPFPSDQTYLITRRVMALRGKKGVLDNDFLLYVLQSPIYKDKLLTKTRGSTVSRVLKTDITGLEIALPLINEQKRIAGILKTIDTKIELNHQINQTLEVMVQAIFKSWFVDFEPVKAKIAAIEAGEDVEGVTCAAMHAISGKTDDELDQLEAEQPQNYAKLKTTAGLFPAAMQDSKLGEVPEGWEVSNFGEVSTCFDKNRIPFSKRQREQKQGLIPYHGATSVMDFVNEHIFDGIYLLIGEDGSVLKDDGTPFIQYIWGKSWVNNHAHVLQGANGVSTEHLMLFMQRQNIAAYVTGAVQLKLNQKNMNSIPFINAGKPINDAFYVSIAPLYEFRRNDKEEIEELSNLRDVLLPKLLSGELEINVTNKVES